MILFVTIIFTAELIVAGALLSLILKADRKVLALNNQIIGFIPVFENGLRETYNIIRGLKKNLHSLICSLRKRKQTYIFRTVKNIILSIILVFSSGKWDKWSKWGKYKKAITLLNIFDGLYNYIKLC